MKDKLLYSAIGGCFGTVLTLIFSLLSPLNAQNKPADAHFDKVTCRELEVISDDKILARLGVTKTRGMDDVTLDMYSPHVRDENMKIQLSAALSGGGLSIYGLGGAEMFLKFGLIKFFSFEGRLEKVIAEDAVYTGVEWFKSVLRSDAPAHLKDVARKELRRY